MHYLNSPPARHTQKCQFDVLRGEGCSDLSPYRGPDTPSRNGFGHGSITPGNLLVDGGSGVKLSDFITAKLAKVTGTSGTMTVFFAAPETMIDHMITGKSDVFSAALVIASLGSAALVIAYIINGEPFIKPGTSIFRACQTLVNGARPKFASDCAP
jgi:serine/threonine protein kinase